MATKTRQKSSTKHPQASQGSSVQRERESTEAEPEQADAFKTLRRAVGDKVIQQSGEIAQSLVESTLKGNSTCARLVLDLVSRRKRNKTRLDKRKRTGLATGPGHCTARDLADDAVLPDDGGDMSLGDPDALRRKGRQADESKK